MAWFEQQRINWIDEMLEVYHFINRQHLQRKFGISEQQASSDLNEFMRKRPGRMNYNKVSKRFEVVVEHDDGS